MNTSTSETNKSFKKGSIIYCEDENPKYLYLIEYGEVITFKEGKNSLVPLAVYNKKSLFGTIALFDKGRQANTAIATEETSLILVKKDDIENVLSECSEWVGNIMSTISTRLRSAIEIIGAHNIEGNISVAPDKLIEYIASLKKYKEIRDDSKKSK